MSSTNGIVTRSSLLLVGPKRSTACNKDLVELHTTIKSTPDLSFLTKSIDELETLWPTIAQAHPKLTHVRGEESLRTLRQFVEHDELSTLTLNGAHHDNIFSNVVTVLSHVVDFWHLATTKIETALLPLGAVTPASGRIQDIQGFCLGFLTAAAVSSSRDKRQLQENVATILRIAACIGALVELDAIELEASGDHAKFLSVTWNSEEQFKELQSALDTCSNGYIAAMTDKTRATVTMLERDANTLKQQLSAIGLSFHPLNIEGRYHNRSIYEDGVRSLSELFQRDPRFQLPSAADLIMPLRSNVDGEIILEGALHELALDSILLEQCQWHTTVQQAVTHGDIPKNSIVRVGTEVMVPRSLSTAWSVPKVTTNVFHQDNGNTFDDNLAVAVVGMACRYPEADSVEELWDLLRAGKSMVRPLPPDRFQTSEITREPKPAFWGNFLRNPGQFDHRFFGISGREAKYMDPQQRLVLEVAYEVLESAGYFGVKSSSETDIGCYVGVGAVDYGDNVASHDATAFSSLGTLRAFISGRISHFFGWSGPSMTFDTACSSGAVAIHTAVNAIRHGECAMAVAGGVNVITSPALFQNLAAASFLSPTGASKAFDAHANGYCRGEGAGLVMLKSLARARADGDSILALIPGSAVNQGANSTPITVPVLESQSSLYKKALSISGIDPKEVSYVEAHGTGTTVGDPIECESIRKTFGGPLRKHELFLGSIKDNIGHTEASSGAAALIKTILMMQKREIPKQANFAKLNPKIAPLEPDNMRIAQLTHNWTVPRRIAVVNNYGAAGSNAAIVVQDVNRVNDHKSSTSLAGSEVPFFISAKTSQSLIEYCAVLKACLPRIQETHGRAAALSLAYNLAVKQSRGFEYTFSFTSGTLDGVASNLSQAPSIDFKKVPAGGRPIVLCIGGQNGRTMHLDEDLVRNSKTLRKHIDDCERACVALGLPSLNPDIFSPEPVEDLVTFHCLLFTCQYASAKAWMDCGARISAIIGHSFGQLTALVVAGSLSLSDGLRFIAARARLIQSSWGPETGAMVSVQGEKSAVERLMKKAKARYPSLAVEVACYNGPETTVLAGDRASIAAVEKSAQDDEFSGLLRLVLLKSTHAFHSSLVEPILSNLRTVAATLEFQQPSIHIEACSKDKDWNQTIDAEALVQQSRMPVYFDDAVKRIESRLGPCVFLEAGSSSPIVPMIRRALNVNESESDNIFQPIDISSPDSLRKLARATSNLWAAGVNLQYWAFHHDQKDGFDWINLPPYQFQKQSHWIEYIAPKTTVEEPAKSVVQDTKQLLHQLSIREHDPKGTTTFFINSSDELFRYCTEGHAVLGKSLCPASMYVEMALRAVGLLSANRVSPVDPCVKALDISSPLSVGSSRNVFLELTPVIGEDETWVFTILSRSQPTAAASTQHATGIISLMVPGTYISASRKRFISRLIGKDKQNELTSSGGSHVLNGNIVYQVFGQVVDYAPYYRGVSQIVSKDQEAVGIVNVPTTQRPMMEETSCDPVTLDNFFQVAGIHINCLSERNANEVFLCTQMGELFLSDTFLAKRREIQSYKVYSSFEHSAAKTVVNDIFVFDQDTGDLLVSLLGAVFQGVPMKSLARTLDKLNSSVNPKEEQHLRVDLQKVTKIDLEPVVPVAAAIHDIAETNGVSPTNTDVLQKIRELFSRVVEISVEEVKPTSTLSELGIDSLMSTEILNEIKQQFDVVIPAETFLALADVQSLTHLLRPSEPVAPALLKQRTVKTIETGHRRGLASCFGQVQDLLGSILDISSKEISADTLLTDLGIDSLLATEVLGEIKQRFGMVISTEEFQEFKDVLSIATRLQTSSSLSPGLHTPPMQAGEADGKLERDINGISEVMDSASTTPFASFAHDSFSSVRSDFDLTSKDQMLARFYSAVYPAQRKLVVTYLIEAFQDMGCSIAALKPGDKIMDIQLVSQKNKVKRRIYEILEDANIIAQDGTGRFVRTTAPVPEGRSEQLHQAIVANFPQHAFEHNLLASTGAKLAECLTGRTDPLAILFGSAKARTLMENVYTHAPMFKTGTVLLSRYLVKIFNTFPETRPIRILELGAGTGGTTKHLVECLTATKKEFQYTFTDISSSLVAAAKKKFAQYDFMHYTVLDIEQEPAFQFINQYDIVISTNCIHATRDLTRSCTNIYKCLRPDGILCLVELTRNLFWFDLVFGLLEGWWLFEDGRQHALASESLWQKHLSRSGFRWIDWTVGNSEESNNLRVITASPSNVARPVTMETATFKRAGDLPLEADIYYPEEPSCGIQVRPVALMIHGGGHVMLSRRDIRPPQTSMLLDAGFLPVSIDYRLCPEVNLLDGPMRDVCDALAWARTVLPHLDLQRRDIRADGRKVVVVGWSTGGHLALTLGFTAPKRGIPPPDAILAFYCPTDYEDPFWTKPNLPFGQKIDTQMQYKLLEGVYDHPITSYNPPTSKRALGGWMNPSDPRSRIALHINWTGRCLRVLLNGLSSSHRDVGNAGGTVLDPTDPLPEPSLEQIQAVSPLAQIERGAYRVPTFIIHGTKDDLIPWQQASRTYEALRQQGVEAEIRILDGAVHLFDLYQSYNRDSEAKAKVQEGYEFLSRYV